MNISILIFNIIIILFLIGIIICSILSLIQISKIPGYTGTAAFKNAYNFNYFVLSFGIFGLISLIFVITTLSYNKYLKTREILFFSFLTFLSFIAIIVFTTLCIFNYRTTYNIINLILGIIGIILIIVYIVLINRLQRKLTKDELIQKEYETDLKTICKNNLEELASTISIKKESKIPNIEPDINETSITTSIVRKEKEPYYDYL